MSIVLHGAKIMLFKGSSDTHQILLSNPQNIGNFATKI